MTAFDATDRSIACVRRQRTNTPLAALVLMNDPQFLEAARQLGTLSIKHGGETDKQRIDYLGRILRGQPFDDASRGILLTALEKFRANLQADPASAKSLLAVGESPASLPVSTSLALNKPATSSFHLGAHPPALANDGLVGDTDRHWGMDVKDGRPAWWQVDLEEPTDVGCVTVVGYYGKPRYYGFTVETSLDGKQWRLVADRRDNKQPSTSTGITCEFPTRKVRYVRVHQTHNSANSGRDLVEVMVYPDASAAYGVKQAVWMMMATTIMNSDEALNK